MVAFQILTVVFLLVGQVALSAPAVQELEIEAVGDPDLLPIVLTERYAGDGESRRLPIKDHLQVYRAAGKDSSDTAITVRASNTVRGRDNPGVFSYYNQTTQTVIDDDPVRATISHFTFYHDRGADVKVLISGCYRNDSAFAVKINPDTDRPEMLFLTTGEDHTGNGRWEPKLLILLVEDYDYDGREEAFVYVSPGRDLEPRELFCIDPEAMEIEWSLPVASVITSGSLHSCRDSIEPGVIFTTANVKNGVEDKYFTDRYSYLVRVNGEGYPVVRAILSEDHDGGGFWPAVEEGIFYLCHALPLIDPFDTVALPPHRHQLSRIDAHGRVLKSIDVSSRLADAWISEYDRREDPCLYTLSTIGEISIYNASLELLARSGDTRLGRFLDTMRVEGQDQPAFLFRTSGGLALHAHDFGHLGHFPISFNKFHPLVYNERGEVVRFIVSVRDKESIVEVKRRTLLSFGRILFWKYQHLILITLTVLALALVIMNSFRQRAVSRLKDSVYRFKEMTDLLPQGVFEINAKQYVTFANREALRMFKLSQVDLDEGLNVFGVVIPEDRERLQKSVEDVLSGEATGGIEYTALRKDGTTFPILTYSDAVSRNGNVVGIRGVVMDISERHKAEAALRESETKWRSLVENIPDIIFAVDAEGKILSVDRTIPGLTKEGGIGKDIYAKVAPQHQEPLKKAVASVFATGHPESLEVLAMGPDGPETAWYQTRIVPLVREGRIEYLEFINTDITERKKAQEALQQSEENYRSLVESAGEAIFTVNRDGEYLFVNSVASTRLGLKPGEIVGRSISELFPPEIATRHLSSIQSIFDSGEGRTLESMTSLQGSKRWYRTSLQPVRNAQGQMVSVLGVARDTTEYVEMRQALGSEQDFVRSMLDTSNSLVFCLDKKARITVFNKECERVTGYKSEEVIGKVWPDLFVPKEYHRHTSEGFAEWVRLHPADAFEDPIVTRDGEIRTILWSNSAMFHPDSDDLTAIAIGQDITERKQTEKDLQESERKYRHLVEHSLQAIFIIQGEKVVLANERTAELFGVDRELLMDASLVSLMDFIVDPKVQRDVQEAYFSLLSGETTEANFEVPVRTSNGSDGWVESLAHRIIYDGEPSVITILIDITDRKVAEAKVQAINQEKYEQAQRIAGGFAHEIRNALFPAEGALYRLAGSDGKRQPVTEGDLNRFSWAAAAAVSRAIDITDLISYYTRLDSGHSPESVELETLIEEILESNELALEDLGVIVRTTGLKGLVVESNRQQLYLVFNNLLLNSLDALTDRDRPAIFVEAIKESGVVRVNFGDNGCGILPDELDKVFDTFFSSKPDKGTGLGLAMCRQIVEMYDGTVCVESTPGEWTRFEVSMRAANTNGRT